MPPHTTRRDTDQRVTIGPSLDGTGGIGSLGVDLYTKQGLLSPFALRRGERVRVQDGSLSRAKGPKRIFVATNTTGSYTFAADAKYATFTPELIPAGGFFFYLHFVATRPSGGNTAYIVGSGPTAEVFNVFVATLSDAGVPVVTWRDSAGTDHTITGAALTAGATVHMLGVYDAVNGTYTLYVDGVSTGTPETGLAATLKPLQTASVVWTLGVKKVTGAAVTANTHFDGAIDSFVIGTMRGINPTAGDPSLLDTLLAHTFRQWPNSDDSKILAHYNLDEPSGTVMYDRSKHKNHGTFVGIPTPSAAVATSFPVGNYVGTFQSALGARTNLVAAAGRLHYETVRSSP